MRNKHVLLSRKYHLRKYNFTTKPCFKNFIREVLHKRIQFVLMHKECECKEFCSQWSLSLKTRMEAGQGYTTSSPHFFSGIVERVKRERAWKSSHVRKARLAFLVWGHFTQMQPVQMQPSLSTTICGTFRITDTIILTILAISFVRPI